MDMHTPKPMYLLVLVLSITSVTAPPVRAQSGYGYSRPITISHTKVPNTDRTNFPVLISGTYSYLATTANGGNVTNSNGYDIIFTSDSAGTQKLPFERESYNPSTGAVTFWVEVPTVSHTTDTVIYLFYGNSSVTTDQSNKTAVWDSNYVGVWHLTETLTGSGQTVHDSTSNGNNLTSQGTWSAAQQIAGQFGGALSTIGANSDQLTVNPRPASLQLSGDLTLEIWINRQEPTNDENDFLLSCCTAYDYDLALTSGQEFLYLAGTWVNGSTAVSNFSWHSLAATKSGTTGTVYLDGAANGTATVPSTEPTNDAALDLLADSNLDPYITAYFEEARISKIGRSADWIATEYNNEINPATFYTIGSPNGPSVTGLSPSSGPVGTSVTITGTNFGSTQGSSTVTFNGTTATPTSWSATTIVATVPSNTPTGAGPVVVTVGGIASNNNYTFTVTSGSGAYSYYRSITISHTKVPNTDRTNFPVLISGAYSYLATTANGGNVTNSNGYDIIFTSDSAGTQKLPFERESYNPSTGAVTFWVEVPTVSHTTDTVIYLFYGNSSVTTDQSNKTGVWDSNYVGVWHLTETLTGSGQTVHDSTSNGNNLTSQGTWSAAQQIAGQFGGALSTIGANSDQLTVNPRPASLQLSGDLTLEIWINRQESTNDENDFLLSCCTAYDYDLALTSGQPFLYLAGTWVHGVNSVSNFAWHSLAATKSGTTGTVYLDGAANGTATVPSTEPTNDAAFDLLADSNEDPYITAYFEEARVSKIGRSADWIATEYNNESSPTNFYTVGSAIGGGGGSVPSITGLSPVSGPVGTSVTITGTNFGSTQGSSTVTFNGTTATPTSWGATSIVAPVPSNTPTGAGPVVVTVGGIGSNSSTFTVTAPAPTITGVSPNSGPVGTAVTITGTNFGSTQGSSIVTFNGTTATPTSWAATSIVAPVPSNTPTGAGPVVVTVGGIASNNNYTFTVTTPAPVISGVSPTSGPLGTSVTITGTNFGSTQGSSTVTFNGVAATPTSWTATSIVAPVPSNTPTGAGPVVVTVGGVASNNNYTFTVGTVVYYYVEDMLGSSRSIVQAGQTSPCYDADFLPFGYEKTVTNTCWQNYKFEGKERDSETNNDDFGARYYSNHFGRWLSPDWSAIPAPVPYANLTNPQTLNLYGMVSDNPESFADLDGHQGGCPTNKTMNSNGECQPTPDNGQKDPSQSRCQKSGEGNCPNNTNTGATQPPDQSTTNQNGQQNNGQNQQKPPDLFQAALTATAERREQAIANSQGPALGSPEYISQFAGQVSAETTAGEKYILAPAAVVEGAGVGTVAGASATAEQVAPVVGAGLNALKKSAFLHTEELQYGTGVVAGLTHSPPPRTAAGIAGYASGKVIGYLINLYRDTR